MSSLVAVVKTGSFIAAAKNLGVSRSLLSKHISQLETSFGAQILHRDTHNVSLTEIGAEYYRFCTQFLESLQSAESSIFDRNRKPHGTLRILAPVAFGSRFMGPVISDFVDQYPEISARISLWGQPMQSSEMVAHSFDLVIRTAPPGDPGNTSFAVRKIAPLRNIFCATPAYLAAHGEPKNFNDLAGHRCLSHEKDTDIRWRSRTGKGLAVLRPPGSLWPQTNSIEILRNWTLSARGIGFLSEYAVYEDIREGRLKAILGNFETEDRGLSLLFPHSRFLPLKTRLFIDFFVQRFNPPPWTAQRAKTVKVR